MITIEIDTKKIRKKLMAERKKERPDQIHNDSYYDGVMDAFLEVEKCPQL